MRTVLLAAAVSYDPPVRLTPGVRKYLTFSTPEPRPHANPLESRDDFAVVSEVDAGAP
jgi:hypothetical protein